MTSRRNLLAGATALAAGAILPARAATLSRGRDDARLLAHAARTRTFVDRYAEVAEEAHRTFDLVQADPVLIPGTYPLAWASSRASSRPRERVAARAGRIAPAASAVAPAASAVAPARRLRRLVIAPPPRLEGNA